MYSIRFLLLLCSAGALGLPLIIMMFLGPSAHEPRLDPREVVVGEIRSIPIGTQPSRAFYLAQALQHWDEKEQSKSLRRYLMHAYINEVAAEEHDPHLTVGQAVERGKKLKPPQSSDALMSKWRAATAVRATVELAGKAEPIPVEIDGVEGRRELVDNRWVYKLDRFDGGLWGTEDAGWRKYYTVARLKNSTTLPLPPLDFTMALGAPEQTDPLVFRCEERRGANWLIMKPGETRIFVCRGLARIDKLTIDSARELLDKARSGQILPVIEMSGAVLDRSLAAIEDHLFRSQPEQFRALQARYAYCPDPSHCADPPRERKVTAASRLPLLFLIALVGSATYLLLAAFTRPKTRVSKFRTAFSVWLIGTLAVYFTLQPLFNGGGTPFAYFTLQPILDLPAGPDRAWRLFVFATVWVIFLAPLAAAYSTYRHLDWRESEDRGSFAGGMLRTLDEMLRNRALLKAAAVVCVVSAIGFALSYKGLLTSN